MKRNYRLKAELAKRGLSYIDLIEQVRERGVVLTEARVCRIVTGRSPATAVEKAAMAEALGVRGWELFVD